MTDITELALIAKIKKQTENFDTVVLKEAEANALVEALEKAQARSSKWLEAYHKAVSVGARYEERIAELESRTVTVKLPDLRQIVSGDRYVWSDGVYNYSQDVKAALTAAGIKWEAE